MSNRKAEVTSRQYPPGRYWIGDLCYVIQDWDKFCDLTIKGEKMLYGDLAWKDGYIWQSSTYFGDGCYYDDDGEEYGVDAGLIGIIPVEMIDRENNSMEGGHIHEFTKAFKCRYYDGEFTFGDVVTIDTNPDSDEDDDYSDETEEDRHGDESDE